MTSRLDASARRTPLHAALLALLVASTAPATPVAPAAATWGGGDSTVDAESGDRETRARPHVVGWELPSAAPEAPATWTPSGGVTEHHEPAISPSAVVASARARRFVTRPRMRRTHPVDPDDH